MEIRSDIQQYAKLALLRTGYVSGQVEVSSKCFQHCRACESWRDDLSGVVRGMWELPTLQALCVELMRTHPFEHLTLTGGDPQAWPYLDAFLNWWAGETTYSRFKLQINTALTQDPDPAQWQIFDDVCVSLDAVQPEIYAKIRGDKQTDPHEVLRRMKHLGHRGLATRTTVMPENLGHCYAILDALEVLHRQTPIRKAVFMAGIGPRVGRDDGFWSRYRELAKDAKSWSVPTSFADDVWETRQFCESDAAKSVPCYAGNISFHAKANGDWYPCCLAGGEAITTYPQLRIGNYFQEVAHSPAMSAARRLLDRYRPHCHYGKADMPCSEICQYKQLQVNLAAHAASTSTLSMP